MAGGSGGSVSDYDRAKLFDKLQQSEEATKDKGFETQVNEYLNDLLAEFNRRSPDVSKHLDEIQKTISDEVGETLKLVFGGSVAKHTYVDGISDVDALVLLGDSDYSNMAPDKVRDRFCNLIKARFPNFEVKAGTLAVTIYFPDVEVQLLPAVKAGRGFKIANASGKEWSTIRPRAFSNLLTKVNQANGSKVVPTIKMVKAINSNLPPSRQLSSYHIESLAVEIFRGYTGPKTQKALLKHFYTDAKERVLKRMPDVTGQSSHVDEYLGRDKSVNRQVVADSLGLLARKMHSADNAGTLGAWQEIIR